MFSQIAMLLLVLLLLSCLDVSAVDSNKYALKPSDKVGVLLLNLGGPDGKDNSVQGFLYNLFADPEIIKLPKCLTPLQKPLAFMISSLRSKRSAANYRMISYLNESSADDAINDADWQPNSPINHFTTDQCDELQVQLQSRDMFHSNTVRCYYAMRYWYPFMDEVVAQMEADGINKLVVLPLYPHYSISTTKSSLLSLNEVFSTPPTSNYWGNVLRMWHTVVPYWYDRPGYVQLLGDMLLEDISQLSADTGAVAAAINNGEPTVINVLFSAHGVPQSYIYTHKDPYQYHIEQSVLMIVNYLCANAEALNTENARCQFDAYTTADTLYKEHLASREEIVAVEMALGGSSAGVPKVLLRFHVSFQSKVGPVDWLQ